MADVIPGKKEFSELSDGFFALNYQGEFTYINGQAEKYFQKSFRQLWGKKIWLEFPGLRETPLQEGCLRALREQKTVQIETDLLLPDHWLDMRIFPSLKGLSVFFSDITARKEREREMIKSDRLHTVEEIAAGMAHEMRNPMTSVRGFLQLFAEKDHNEKNREILHIMIDEVDRCNAIIAKFLLLAKNRVIHTEACNLPKLVCSMEPLLAAERAGTGKDVFFDLEDVPDIFLDKSEIRQLILNLTRNGLEATKAGQTLTVKVYQKEHSVFLEIQDTGSGISTEVIDKIGTPFVTTKEHGSGLGLAICYSIVKRHQGEIWFKTGPRGTTFFVRFYLPD